MSAAPRVAFWCPCGQSVVAIYLGSIAATLCLLHTMPCHGLTMAAWLVLPLFVYYELPCFNMASKPRLVVGGRFALGTALRVAFGVVVVSRQLLCRGCRCNPEEIPPDHALHWPRDGCLAGSLLIRLHRTALLYHGIQTWGSELGAVDDDANGSDAAVERGDAETVEKVEGGED